MIAVSTPGGVVFRDFDPERPTVATVNAEAASYREAARPRCPTARQLLCTPPATVAGTTSPENAREASNGKG